MKDRTRWGIIGTGAIARKFAEAVDVMDNAVVTAVLSRRQESADEFGRKFGVGHCCDSAGRFFAGERMDIVYVATPHPMHAPDTLACLEAGRPVLCEKPFALNSLETSGMIRCAREKRLLLIEAMWTHFFPAMVKTRDLVREGSLGEIKLVQAGFCFRAKFDPSSRLFDPSLGGGALLDVGVYPISFAQMVYGRRPLRVSGVTHIGRTGVDEQSAVTLDYGNGAMAVLTCSITATTVHEAFVYGTEGYVRIPHPFWQADHIFVNYGGSGEKEMTFDRFGNGYTYEILEAMRCLKAGELESPVMPLERTEAVMEIMDEARRQWGLVYPSEKDQIRGGSGGYSL